VVVVQQRHNLKSSLLHDEEGSVFVEYIVLAGLFSLVVAGAVIALGEPLLSYYQHTQLVWAGSFP
jgi:Flp pilus assembly pilin Flp